MNKKQKKTKIKEKEKRTVECIQCFKPFKKNIEEFNLTCWACYKKENY